MWTLRPFYSTNDRHGTSFPVSKLVSYVEMKQAKQQMLLLQDIWHRKKGTVTIYNIFLVHHPSSSTGLLGICGSALAD